MRTWVNPFISVKFRYFWSLILFDKNVQILKTAIMTEVDAFGNMVLRHDKERIFPMKEQAYAESDVRYYQ